MDETGNDSGKNTPGNEAAGSDCLCSDCVSEVSFQLYDESSFICVNCDYKNDVLEQEVPEVKKDEKNDVQ